jgi:hypothetical protein
MTKNEGIVKEVSHLSLSREGIYSHNGTFWLRSIQSAYLAFFPNHRQVRRSVLRDADQLCPVRSSQFEAERDWWV